jgi:hypothetical protein
MGSLLKGVGFITGAASGEHSHASFQFVPRMLDTDIHLKASAKPQPSPLPNTA